MEWKSWYWYNIDRKTKNKIYEIEYYKTDIQFKSTKFLREKFKNNIDIYNEHRKISNILINSRENN